MRTYCSPIMPSPTTPIRTRSVIVTRISSSEQFRLQLEYSFDEHGFCFGSNFLRYDFVTPGFMRIRCRKVSDVPVCDTNNKCMHRSSSFDFQSDFNKDFSRYRYESCVIDAEPLQFNPEQTIRQNACF